MMMRKRRRRRRRTMVEVLRRRVLCAIMIFIVFVFLGPFFPLSIYFAFFSELFAVLSLNEYQWWSFLFCFFLISFFSHFFLFCFFLVLLHLFVALLFFLLLLSFSLRAIRCTRFNRITMMIFPSFVSSWFSLCSPFSLVFPLFLFGFLFFYFSFFRAIRCARFTRITMKVLSNRIKQRKENLSLIWTFLLVREARGERKGSVSDGLSESRIALISSQEWVFYWSPRRVSYLVSLHLLFCHSFH